MSKLLCILVSAWLTVVTIVPATADIAIVVSAKSTAGNLTRDQVEDIYRLKLKELPGVGQVTPMMQGNGPSRDEFLAKIMNSSDAQMKGYWAKLTFTGKGIPPKESPNSGEMKKTLAANPGMIGYIEKSDVDSSVKVLFAP